MLPAKRAESKMMKYFIILVVVFCLPITCYAQQVPSNLWKGLIAEDTSGDLEVYRLIASVVRNRFNKGLNCGLVALKRKNLDEFVKNNSEYMKIKGVNLEALSKQAIKEVFNLGLDFADGATHYEHTGRFQVPYWAEKMTIVKVLYPGTKKELTLWK